MRAKFLIASLLAACVAPALCSEAIALAPQEVVHETWTKMTIQDTKIGYAHEVTIRELDGDQVRYVTTTVGEMDFARLGSNMTIRSEGRIVEDDAERILEILSVMDMSNQPTTITGVVDGDVLRVTTEVGGTKREAEIPWDAAVLSPMAIHRIHIEQVAGAPGTLWETKMFEASIGQSYIAKSERGPDEELVMGDRTVKASIVYTSSDIMPGMRSTTWLGADGATLRDATPMTGLELISDTCTREEALDKDAGGGKSIDVLAATLVTCNVRIPHARKVDEVLYELTLREGVTHWPELGVDPRQVTKDLSDRTRQMRITRREPEPGARSRPLDSVPEELSECLLDTSMIQCDEPALRAKALELVADVDDAWAAAQLLEKWVFNHITKKDYATGFASASEVFHERTGDCSEHAMLLAAMSRAAGIPSRVVMGLVYVQGSFAGHAWNEVWIGDWYALDATNGYGWVDAAHISLASSAMTDSTGLGGFNSLNSVLGNLDVTVKEMRYGDVRVDAEDPDQSFRRDGETAVFPLLGLSFNTPESWSFALAPIRKGFTSKLCELDAPGSSDDIEVHASTVPYAFALDELRERFTGAEDIEVDGRVALAAVIGGTHLVFLLEGDTLFHFELDVSSEDTLKVFEEFLQTVDLDVAMTDSD